MRIRILLLAALFLTAAAPARADDCVDAYNRAVYPYWLIINDILTYQAMFDNYDRLCTRYYPDVVNGLQPGAGRLRAQVKIDAADTGRVIALVIDQALPNAVPPACRADKKARARVKAAILVAMSGRGKTIAGRLKRDSTNLPDAKNALSICARLPDLAPIIVKTLGPDLRHPLLEMSVLNSQYMTGEAASRAPALANYRGALEALEAADVRHHRAP